MADEILYSNGIRAEDGQHGARLSINEIYEMLGAARAARDPGEQALVDLRTQGRPHTFGLPPSLAADVLAQARWGVIWPPEPLTPAEVAHRDALSALIEHRRRQMGGRIPHQFHYRAGWDYVDFLWEEGREVEPGNMQPSVIPYYLCIVGSPERIPWDFQQCLDGEYAVGRIWSDDPRDCERYLERLLAYERATEVAHAREALFVGPRHAGDTPTQQSAASLVQPLHEWLAQPGGLGFTTTLLLGDQPGGEAYKKHVVQRLKGFDLDGAPRNPPALLFAAGHGLEYSVPSDRQYARQGALIFQEWPGASTAPQPEHYLIGDEISADMQLTGSITFSFACFSAGTPLFEDWVYASRGDPVTIADRPFVSRLPQKLMGQGQLGFIGHVSRAWDFSFLGIRRASSQLTTFRETIGELLRGQPLGHATNYLNTAWIHQTALLDTKLNNRARYTRADIVDTWKARNDCRGYVVLGDPAARLRAELFGRG